MTVDAKAIKARENAKKEAAMAAAAKKKLGQRHVHDKLLDICFDFTRGQCNRGDSCRFSHDPSLVAAPASAGGDGAQSDAADAGDDELPEIDINDTQ